MSKQWIHKENEIFIHLMDVYRNDITGRPKKSIIAKTTQYAKRLKEVNELLNDRTVQALDEHLSYFDDMMAGVGTPNDYARKDKGYFGIKARNNGNLDQNPARVIRSKKVKIYS